MARTKGSKNRKKRVVTPEQIAQLRANAQKRHENAHGNGKQVRLDPVTVERLFTAIPKREVRRAWIIRVINDALDHLTP